MSRSCRSGIRASFPDLITSEGMPSSPGALPLGRESIALLSSCVEGSSSSSTRVGSISNYVLSRVQFKWDTTRINFKYLYDGLDSIYMLIKKCASLLILRWIS